MIFSQPEAKTDKGQEDISWQGALSILIALAGLGGYLNWHKFEPYYFRHFEVIYLTLYLLAVTLFGGLIVWQIVKHTKDFSVRARLLFAFANPDRGLFVGITTDGLRLYLPDDIRIGHVQILGSTGRGKTESVIIPWLARDILAGRSVILLDGKGDPDIVDKICKVAGHIAPAPELCVFDLGNPTTSCTTNPLAHGSAQQITDRIFTAFEFGDAYYKSVQYDVCSSVVSLMLSAPKDGETTPQRVTFERLYRLLTDEEALSAILVQSGNPLLEQKVSAYLSLPRQIREERLSGLLSQLAPFAIGEVAPLVNGRRNDETPDSTISKILLQGASDGPKQKIFLILLPTLKYQQLGRQLGKLLLQELGWVVGERASRTGRHSPFTPVYLDEFSAFVYPGFTNILNKARSSQIPFHLSHQSLGDLEMVSPEFAQVIATNTNVKCILGLNDPESADFMARHMGTRTEEKLTEQAEKNGFLDPKRRTGALSIREVESYKIHPNDLKGYVNGRGVIHFPSPRGNVTEEIQFTRLSVGDFMNRGRGNG